MNWYLDANQWTTAMKLWFAIPSVVIGICYLWIPLNGFLHWKNHRDGLGQHKTLLLWYAGLIFASGINRILNMLAFSYPTYEVRMISLSITAIFAVKAAWGTRSFFKDLVRLPSRQELHDALDLANKHKVAYLDADATKDTFIREQTETIIRLKDMIETQVWLHDKDLALKELNTMLERMRE